VLAGFNRLSPDELARVGLSRHDPSDHPIRRVAIAFLAIEAILFGIVAFVSDGTRGDALVALLTGALFTLAVVRRSRQPRIPDDARPMRGAP
jgi:energy-coupling factor transporter transmembrane protein EcfT